jgi:hypothetical protein
MNHVDKISSVIYDDVGTYLHHTAYVAVIFLLRGIIPGKDLQPVMYECSSHVILCGKGI